VNQALFVLQLAIELAFALLAIRTVVSWVRQPDARHGNLALALSALTLVIVLSSLFGGSGVQAQLFTDAALIMFLVSGYGLLMFRDSFVPLSPATTRAVTVAIVVIGLLGIMQELYDDMIPGITDHQAGYARDVSERLNSAAEVVFTRPARNREDIEAVTRELIAEARLQLPDFRLAVEFRNHRWLDGDECERTLGFLEDLDLAFVCVDEPQGYDSSMPPVVAATSDLAIVRFHGASATIPRPRIP